MSDTDSFPTRVANQRSYALDYVAFVNNKLDKALVTWAQGRYTEAEEILSTSLNITEFEENCHS